MADEYIRKEYAGGAPATTIPGALSNSATSITIQSGTGQPTGAIGKFVMVIDRGNASEEKVLVTSRSGTALNTVQRGYDGTAAVSHLAGATIEHCIDAYTFDQANAMASAATSQYDLIYRGASDTSWGRIPIGASGQVLSVSSGVPSWQTITSAFIPDGTITGAKLADGTVELADLATALANLLVPVGMVAFTIATAAPAGWLFHNQAVATASTLYPALWAAAPASWKSGTTLTIPDLTDTVLAQTGGSAAALGAVGGAMTTTIASANLPTHTHTMDHDHPSATTSSDGAHVHSYTGSGPNQNGVMLTASAASSFTLGNGGALQAYATYASAMNSDGAHQHTLDVANFTGSTGNGGFANTAMTTRPRHLGCNVMIKAH